MVSGSLGWVVSVCIHLASLSLRTGLVLLFESTASLQNSKFERDLIEQMAVAKYRIFYIFQTMVHSRKLIFENLKINPCWHPLRPVAAYRTNKNCALGAIANVSLTDVMPAFHDMHGFLGCDVIIH